MTTVSEPVLGSAARAVADLRERVTAGQLAPGTRLSETSWTGPLGVSRNTLREAFSTLIEEGLLVRVPHRGVFVATLSPAQIADIYRVRVLLECTALRQAPTDPPRVAGLRTAVDDAERHAAAGDWSAVGTANMRFHEQIIALADSPRLNAWMKQLTAELRLAFVAASDTAALHRPFVPLNAEIVALYEAGDAAGAADRLRDYLLDSERVVLGALVR
ncbi:GntR family transcriptional regulator [Cryptosporangium aurantiacum]|uniref:DNA-binding transcriptional regulator, GntR family n=1 Tax=Cryptosporangium aurantiacum TaxID=134849 RepID=A0A1M7RIX4_9ACTN|nr:GntR family transcriptional regulator [Cryptosporangium aurantiacum]SHN46285.1 DNA-binding transcriptional regulator, GntR family [Cryptosporangium aurantiacum]